jgi:hypothetical protein
MANPKDAPTPNVVVNVPGAPVLVDRYYRLKWAETREDRSTGLKSRHEGTQVHVRSVLARLSDDGKTAYPVDGSKPLPFGPGKPGCFGVPEALDEFEDE